LTIIRAEGGTTTRCDGGEKKREAGEDGGERGELLGGLSGVHGG